MTSTTTRETPKQRIDRLLSEITTTTEFLWRQYYDTPEEAAEDVKAELDKWVASFTENCTYCQHPARYCECP